MRVSICPQCSGTGWIQKETRAPSGIVPDAVPCDYPGCAGGIISCCEGDCAQPEGESEDGGLPHPRKPD